MRMSCLIATLNPMTEITTPARLIQSPPSSSPAPQPWSSRGEGQRSPCSPATRSYLPDVIFVPGSWDYPSRY